MSQQINLYNPALRKRQDWLTARPLAAVAAGLLVVVAAVAGFSSYQARQSQAAADDLTAKLKATQAEIETLTKAVAERKPDPAIVAKVAETKLQFKARQEVMDAIAGGAIGSSEGFSEYLRGFSRQTPQGVWLTGFTIGAGGNDMEIRGRMLSDSLLPEYVKRLSGEKVFKGRSFAGLELSRPAQTAPAAAAPAATGATAATPAAPQSARYVEFVLMPRPQAAGETKR